MGGKQTERLMADDRGIARAAELLRAGALVALPTETVYGLAGRADCEAAVAAIFRAKGRPDFNPLIVHVGTQEMAKSLGRFNARAECLARAFWPGPLTVVVPLRPGESAVPATTGGLPTIALRMPDHPAMQAVLSQLALPLAAPSANRSGLVTSTSAEHVAASLGGRIDAILDAGASPGGLESSIVAVSEDGWRLLRSGPIEGERIVELIGPQMKRPGSGIEAPGQLASHYSPGKPVRLNASAAKVGEFMIGFGGVPGDCSLAPDGDLALAAARLYSCLHEAAASSTPRVAVAAVPDEGIGAAINDRLRRAAA